MPKYSADKLSTEISTTFFGLRLNGPSALLLAISVDKVPGATCRFEPIDRKILSACACGMVL